MKRNEERNLIFKEIDSEYLLEKYGPEGLYDLAKMLMKVANKDISDAMLESWHPEKEGFEKEIKEAGDSWGYGGPLTGTVLGDQYNPGHTSPFEGKRPGSW